MVNCSKRNTCCTGDSVQVRTPPRPISPHTGHVATKKKEIFFLPSPMRGPMEQDNARAPKCSKHFLCSNYRYKQSLASKLRGYPFSIRKSKK